MLRVVLDGCVVSSGVTEFGGVPLTGVGAEILGLPKDRNREVRLWEYLDGRRVGAWHEPTFLGDQSLLLDESTVLCEDESQRWIVGRPSKGAEMTMRQSVVLVMEAFYKGAVVVSPRTRWYDDGSLASVACPVVVEHVDGPAILVNESGQWSPGAAFGLTGDAAIEVSLNISHGIAGDKVGWLAPGFASYDSDHPDHYHLGLHAGRDGQGRLDHFGIRGSGYESALKQIPDFVPTTWFPDYDYISEHGFAPEVRWESNREGHDDAVDAIGGIEALNNVELLDLSRSQLTPDQLAQLFELPLLHTIKLTSGYRKWNELVTEVVALRRPDLQMITLVRRKSGS